MNIFKSSVFTIIIVGAFFLYKMYSNENYNTTNKKEKQNTARSKVYFYEKEYDFGKIHDGDSVKHIFKFKNIGNANLKVIDVSSSCGCTIPTWTNKQVKPNELGDITVNFYKKDDLGIHKRLVIVKTNSTPEYSTLKIVANVIK